MYKSCGILQKEKIEKAFSKFIIPHFGEFERMKGKKDFLVSNVSIPLNENSRYFNLVLPPNAFLFRK